MQKQNLPGNLFIFTPWADNPIPMYLNTNIGITLRFQYYSINKQAQRKTKIVYIIISDSFTDGGPFSSPFSKQGKHEAQYSIWSHVQDNFGKN